MTFKIAGCAGHGGKNSTPGKRTPDGEYEWNFNDKVIDSFEKEILTYQGVEFRRFDDRTGNTDVPLKVRTDGANKWGADLYISFHHNANTGKWGNWTGIETYTQPGVSGITLKYAEVIHQGMINAYKLRNRGLKTKDLHITRETHMPAVLVEGGYMDSKIDIVKLRDNKVLENAGKQVAIAVARFKGLKKKPVFQYHIVVKGDTLWSISRKYSVGVQQIKVWNNLKTDIIQPGDKLRVK